MTAGPREAMFNQTLYRAAIFDLDGTLVQVWRSGIDGRIVVHVDTSAGLDEDHHEPGGCPKIRVGINDHYTNLEPGGWEEQDG